MCSVVLELDHGFKNQHSILSYYPVSYMSGLRIYNASGSSFTKKNLKELIRIKPVLARKKLNAWGDFNQ